MTDFFVFDDTYIPVVYFSTSHWVILAVISLTIAFLYVFRMQIKKNNNAKYFRFGLAFMLIIFELALYVWYFTYDNWSIKSSLPLQLCLLTTILSIIMLLNKNYRIYEFTYFTGIGGAIQALITPAGLLSGFPHFTFYYFFVGHAGIITACLFMTWILEYRPYLRSIWRTFFIGNIYMAFVGSINWLIGSNYMFLAHKPSYPSLLDYLGPWPWYIISLEVIALITFFILYIL
jgi:hypothetical integral membrane protein (TIGR02206 family)